jgi:hypothetical protein
MLKAHEIIKLWEVAADKQLWQKAVLMLAATHADEPLESLALLSIGNRNEKLFRLRDRLFGTVMNANSSCAACDEKIEFQLDSKVICNPDLPLWDGREITLDAGSDQLICRPVNSYDLRDVYSVLEVEGPECAEQELIFRCVLQFKRDGVSQPVRTLPEELIEKVAEQIKTADVHSEILCRLNCPQCAHSWLEPFDIARFLWHELEVKAQIILSEVQALARAFGWWEGDILSLSDVRRKYYLEGLNE